MGIQRREFVALAGNCVAGGLVGCVAPGGNEADGGPEISGETLTLTTTTSTYDTGLLDTLNAPFEARYGVTVNTVSQGTGAALETGRNGDCDVVMVHARALEDEFMEEGYGLNRRDIMFNDFVVVGEPDDPAGIAEGEDVVEAFREIAATESTFVSRGDNSGTHTKELEIWDAAGVGVEDRGEWYREAGQGMGEVLVQTAQSGGYTLTDRGTFLPMRMDIDLEIHIQGPVEGGPELLSNRYGIVAVNPAIHDHVEYDLAMAYIGFITSIEGQRLIEEYTVEGEQLFFPQALSENPKFQQYVPRGWSEVSDESNQT